MSLKLSPEPVHTRYLRIWMTESSNTCDLHGSSDIRDCVGYAIQDMHAGVTDGSGQFADAAEGATGKDAPTYCSSSIDPWHSAADLNDHSVHTGFDLFYTAESPTAYRH